jgi:hypothetical protein
MTGGDDVDSAFRALLRQHAGRMHYTLDESLLQTILNIEWKDDIKQNFRGGKIDQNPTQFQYHPMPLSHQ